MTQPKKKKKKISYCMIDPMAEGKQQQETIPPWMLAPYEEKEVRKICQDLANEKCADVFRAFGDCSKQHQILFSWKCAEQKNAMINCVSHWGGKEVFEQERNKFIERKIEKLEQETKGK